MNKISLIVNSSKEYESPNLGLLGELLDGKNNVILSIPVIYDKLTGSRIAQSCKFVSILSINLESVKNLSVSNFHKNVPELNPYFFEENKEGKENKENKELFYELKTDRDDRSIFVNVEMTKILFNGQDKIIYVEMMGSIPFICCKDKYSILYFHKNFFIIIHTYVNGGLYVDYMSFIPTDASKLFMFLRFMDQIGIKETPKIQGSKEYITENLKFLQRKRPEYRKIASKLVLQNKIRRYKLGEKRLAKNIGEFL